MRIAALLFALAFPAYATPSAAEEQASRLPLWWLEHVEFMSRDGGAWIAPNPGNDADPSQPDAFGMQWRASNENHVLTGRLYGVEAGQETAEFWSFREFYHPGEQRVVLQQWGGPGVYGTGYVAMDQQRGVADQTFWLPDGRSWREGHRTIEEGDTYVTESFDIDAAGNWTAKNTFTWQRAN